LGVNKSCQVKDSRTERLHVFRNRRQKKRRKKMCENGQLKRYVVISVNKDTGLVGDEAGTELDSLVFTTNADTFLSGDMSDVYSRGTEVMCAVAKEQVEMICPVHFLEQGTACVIDVDSQLLVGEFHKDGENILRRVFVCANVADLEGFKVGQWFEFTAMPRRTGDYRALEIMAKNVSPEEANRLLPKVEELPIQRQISMHLNLQRMREALEEDYESINKSSDW
jgi:hypothetical protein